MKNQIEDLGTCQTTTIAKLPKGEWFTLTQTPNAKVYRKFDYNRSTKKFLCEDVCDAGGAGRELKGTKVVFFGFTY
jgi:hypothetical protein